LHSKELVILKACFGDVQGKRYSLPNSRIMIHQPLGGAQGQAAGKCCLSSCQYWSLIYEYQP
jgi:ATP-dependent protease ClpP protease subunit